MCPKKSTLKLPEPEWSVWVKADEIPADGKQVDLSPDASQLPLIAQRVGVLSLDSLRASLSLSKSKGGVMVHVTGDAVGRNCPKLCGNPRPDQEQNSRRL
jgi:hypothetical protein